MLDGLWNRGWPRRSARPALAAYHPVWRLSRVELRRAVTHVADLRRAPRYAACRRRSVGMRAGLKRLRHKLAGDEGTFQAGTLGRNDEGPVAAGTGRWTTLSVWSAPPPMTSSASTSAPEPSTRFKNPHPSTGEGGAALSAYGTWTPEEVGSSRAGSPVPTGAGSLAVVRHPSVSATCGDTDWFARPATRDPPAHPGRHMLAAFRGRKP